MFSTLILDDKLALIPAFPEFVTVFSTTLFMSLPVYKQLYNIIPTCPLASILFFLISANEAFILIPFSPAPLIVFPVKTAFDLSLITTPCFVVVSTVLFFNVVSADDTNIP